MNNAEFKKTDNIRKYLVDALEKGELQAGLYQKSGEITARVGIPGEKIVTIMADGLEETENTVVLDENGNPGWVVTNSTGEEYIVKDSVFRKKYERVPDTANRFRPLRNPITACQIHENICFTAPWGEIMNIAAGGYLVFNKDFDDIYGIQKAEFDVTYYKIESDSEES